MTLSAPPHSDADVILHESIAELSNVSPRTDLQRFCKVLGPLDRYTVDGPAIPILEDSLSDAQLPDYLLVHDPQCMTEWRAAYRSLDWATPYYRVKDPEHGLGNVPQAEQLRALLEMDERERRSRTARLFIHYKNGIGQGHHSFVYLAPLSLEGGEGARRAVAAKVAIGTCDELESLRNEASMFTSFPEELMTGTSENPAVVPKFYGLYMPLDPEHQVNKHRRTCRALSSGIKCTDEIDGSILLAEACGVPLSEFGDAEYLKSHQGTLHGLMERFHDAGFLHGAVYARNILMQPGPLQVPPEHRNYATPAFRLIDFGRTVEHSHSSKAALDQEQVELSLELEDPRRQHLDTPTNLWKQEKLRLERVVAIIKLDLLEKHLVREGLV